MSVAPEEQQTPSLRQEPQEECASEGIPEEFIMGDIDIDIEDEDEDEDDLCSMLAGRNHSLTTVSSSSPIDARIECPQIMEHGVARSPAKQD